MTEDIFREGDSVESFDAEVLEDFGDDIVSVVDENGKEHVFEELDRVELPGGTYVALAPLVGEDEEDDDEDDELILLRVEEEDGEVYLSILDSDEEFSLVAKTFSQRLGIPYEE